MTLEITALEDHVESINMLVYGDPGAGKTVLGGTAPNALIVATEPGTIAAARQGSKAHLYKAPDYRAFAQFLNAARRNEVLNPQTGEPYDWYVIDSLTELQQQLIRDIMQRAHAENKNRSEIIPDMLGHQEWQQTFKRVVHALNDLPQNVLYLAHAMRAEDEEGDPIILPDLTGKNGTQDSTTMSRWTVGTMHLYGYLAVGKKRDGSEGRRLIVERDGPYFGKDRYNAFGGKITSPNIEKIAETINK